MEFGWGIASAARRERGELGLDWWRRASAAEGTMKMKTQATTESDNGAVDALDSVGAAVRTKARREGKQGALLYAYIGTDQPEFNQVSSATDGLTGVARLRITALPEAHVTVNNDSDTATNADI